MSAAFSSGALETETAFINAVRRRTWSKDLCDKRSCEPAGLGMKPRSKKDRSGLALCAWQSRSHGALVPGP